MSEVKFLMYRVELKGISIEKSISDLFDVPNVPCGVESPLIFENKTLLIHVPNVPCGVESSSSSVGSPPCIYISVPNVPCGVESL